MKDIGALTKDTGCVVCGKKGASMCSGCHKVAYCGKGARPPEHSAQIIEQWLLPNVDCQMSD